MIPFMSMQTQTSTNMFKAKYSAPSNIALIKYWGKKDFQKPINPSISMTLKNCSTETEITYIPGEKLEIEFYLKDKKEPSFITKIEKLFGQMESEFPWIKKGRFEIHSNNSFPHSSGIASSASGMAAIVLCIFDINAQIKKIPFDLVNEAKRISEYARLGSGSAARSVYPFFSIWGKTKASEISQDSYAVGYNNFSDFFKSFCDTILIVNKDKKSVSSSEGHSLMDTHPYKEVRISEANRKLITLIEIMKSDDFSSFAECIEQEALELHSLMMTSNPSFILLEPESIRLIKEIRDLRKTGKKVSFTIDAGPNIHLIYPKSEFNSVKELCEIWQKENVIIDFIHDEIGMGPFKI